MDRVAPLMQDFRGERAARGSDVEPEEGSFDKQDRKQASGAPVTIRRTSAGFFASAIADLRREIAISSTGVTRYCLNGLMAIRRDHAVRR